MFRKGAKHLQCWGLTHKGVCTPCFPGLFWAVLPPYYAHYDCYARPTSDGNILETVCLIYLKLSQILTNMHGPNLWKFQVNQANRFWYILKKEFFFNNPLVVGVRVVGAHDFGVYTQVFGHWDHCLTPQIDLSGQNGQFRPIKITYMELELF